MKKHDFLTMLIELQQAIQLDDSFEGRLEYQMGWEKDTYLVKAFLRVGNSLGQGSCIMVEDQFEDEPIQTREEHAAALAEVEPLIALDPEIGTPEAEKLNRLADRIETYEKVHFPIDPPLSRAEQIEAIIKWQTCLVVHPLTCGKDSNHRELIPWLLGDSVILTCIDCEYMQFNVPESVYGLYTAAKKTKDYYEALYGSTELTDMLRESAKEPVCEKCGVQLVPGRAIENTAVSGAPDFDESDKVVTMHVGGPGKMIDCLKCPSCGYSARG